MIYLYTKNNMTDILGSSTLALAMFDCQTVITDDIIETSIMYTILFSMVKSPLNWSNHHFLWLHHNSWWF